MSDLYFNIASDYSEKNFQIKTSEHLNHFNLSLNRKKRIVWEPQERSYRSSHSQIFFKIGFLKTFKRDPNLSAFLWNLQSFCEHLFYGTPLVAASETKHIHVSAADLLHIRIGSLDWCKCKNCKNEARETDCYCCREVDAMLIASAKIPEHEESISPSSFYGQLPDC